MTPERFKWTVAAAVARGEPARNFIHAARHYLGDEAEAFLASFPATPAARPQSAPPPPKGPGTELKKLLAEVGLTTQSGCGCNDKARLMDQWGVAGCRERREEIACWLAGAASKAGWSTLLTVGPKMLFSKWFRLLDPYHSFVDESIRRAEAAQ